MTTAPHNTAHAARVLSVGLIGAGEIASKVHLPVLAAIPDLRLAYVADVNAGAAAAAARNFGGVAVTIGDDVSALPSTDIVLLSTPVGARAPYYRLLAERGTAVLAEKPLAVSAAEAQAWCELFPPHRLACSFQRRTYAGVTLAQDCVARGLFGPLRQVRIAEGARTTKTGTDARFYDDWTAGHGGVLRDLGSHALDVIFYVTGSTDAQVRTREFFIDGRIDREVKAHVEFSSPQGEFGGDIFVTWLQQANNTIEFVFDGCILSIPTRPEGLTRLLDRDRRPVGATLQSQRRSATTTAQAFFLEWEAFMTGLRLQQASLVSAASCLPTIRLIDQLYAGVGNK